MSKACLAKLESVTRVSTPSRVHVHLQLTRLPDAEKLVGVPTDDTAGQSTPAPLHYAAKSLFVVSGSVTMLLKGGGLPMARRDVVLATVLRLHTDGSLRTTT